MSIGEDSDVFVGCSRYEITLKDKGYFVRGTPKEVLSVLEVLGVLGYKIPKCAIERLTKEAQKND